MPFVTVGSENNTDIDLYNIGRTFPEECNKALPDFLG
jgi:hypothetical protein